MKKKSLTKMLLWLSVVCNVCLLGLVVRIGVYNTNYAYNKLRNMGFIEMDVLKQPDYHCNRGWANTLEKLDVDVDVVFFGNSITCQSDFRTYFPHVSICNLGYPGDTPAGMSYRVNQIKAVHPEKVFVMAGINGLREQSERAFQANYSAMLDSIMDAVPQAQIYIQSILPVNLNMKNGKYFKGHTDKIVKANEFIQELAKQRNCVYIDLYHLYADKNGFLPAAMTKDGLHLLPEAYKTWADAIRPYIDSCSVE